MDVLVMPLLFGNSGDAIDAFPVIMLGLYQDQK
jgi:hypothetical protein